MKLLFLIVCILLIFQDVYGRLYAGCYSNCRKIRKERGLKYLKKTQENILKNISNMRKFMDVLKNSCVDNTTKTCSNIIRNNYNFELYINRNLFSNVLSKDNIKYHIRNYLCTSQNLTHNEFAENDVCYIFNQQKIDYIRNAEKIKAFFWFGCKIFTSILILMTVLSVLKS